jgi:predicted transcriptional regulator
MIFSLYLLCDPDCVSAAVLSSTKTPAHIIQTPLPFFSTTILCSRLCDDIVFCPHNIDFRSASDEQIAEAFDPIAQGNDKYNNNEYALGFFAAIAVQANDVSISLNGHSISQCREHALMQRFFAVIELASSPFIRSAGPHNFVTTEFKAAKNFKLTGPGTVGLSSHHGIHGNDNENVQISYVTFKDFEVGAVSLNNVKGLEIKKCNIPNNRHDVPVLGSFSAALKMRPYLKHLKATNPGYSMTLGGIVKSVEDVYNTLVGHIANVYKDVMDDGIINATTHPDEYRLYNNPHQVIDGPCYVFLVHGKGPAIGGFGDVLSTDASALSADVSIVDNKAQNIRCFTDEVLATVVDARVQNDARGAILQFYNSLNQTYIGINESSGKYTYTGNVNLDAQIMVGKAIQQGLLGDNILQTNVNSVGPSLIKWAEGNDPSFTPKFRCNGDSMHHVIKGSVMIRVEDCQGFKIHGNSIDQVEILSHSPVDLLCADFHKGASSVDYSARMIADLRGISVAAVSAYNDDRRDSNSIISHNIITNLKSESAKLIAGIDIQGVSEGVDIEDNYVNVDPSVSRDAPDEKCIGLRIRRNATAIFANLNNNFVQGMVDEVIKSSDSSRKLLPEHHPRPAGDLEWPNNGCPFGH